MRSVFFQLEEFPVLIFGQVILLLFRTWMKLKKKIIHSFMFCFYVEKIIWILMFSVKTPCFLTSPQRHWLFERQRPPFWQFEYFTYVLTYFTFLDILNIHRFEYLTTLQDGHVTWHGGAHTGSQSSTASQVPSWQPFALSSVLQLVWIYQPKITSESLTLGLNRKHWG